MESSHELIYQLLDVQELYQSHAKKSGAVHICVDLKALNESVLREVYPLPTVDDLLRQLTGATIFSRLDANSGFWQIPLCPESRLLTTFITP